MIWELKLIGKESKGPADIVLADFNKSSTWFITLRIKRNIKKSYSRMNGFIKWSLFDIKILKCYKSFNMCNNWLSALHIKSFLVQIESKSKAVCKWYGRDSGRSPRYKITAILLLQSANTFIITTSSVYNKYIIYIYIIKYFPIFAPDIALDQCIGQQL